MNISKLSLVPLQQASLCLDCDMITAAHTHCYACGSVALLDLAKTLNGGYATSTPRELVMAARVSVRETFGRQNISSARPRG